MTKYMAEGLCGCVPQSVTKSELIDAMKLQTVLESVAKSYDTSGNLHFNLGNYEAIMPHEECAHGVAEGEVRDVALMACVGRSTCFIITDYISDAFAPYFVLSRRAVQHKCQTTYLDALRTGDVIPCRVTHLERFGAFCDIGSGISALLPIDCISLSRISAPSDRLQVGQTLYCVVKARDDKKRLVLTLKELLGTWEENAAKFHAGETVVGIVRSTEEYGVFIELAPNLAGLAETSGAYVPGQQVSVYIKSLLPNRMKVKLAILHPVPAAPLPPICIPEPTFSHLSRWVYSPASAAKVVETIFDA